LLAPATYKYTNTKWTNSRMNLFTETVAWSTHNLNHQIKGLRNHWRKQWCVPTPLLKKSTKSYSVTNKWKIRGVKHNQVKPNQWWEVADNKMKKKIKLTKERRRKGAKHLIIQMYQEIISLGNLLETSSRMKLKSLHIWDPSCQAWVKKQGERGILRMYKILISDILVKNKKLRVRMKKESLMLNFWIRYTQRWRKNSNKKSHFHLEIGWPRTIRKNHKPFKISNRTLRTGT